MDFEGGCYCGKLRYRAVGEPLFKALCHCRQCQYFSGGMAALLIGMPRDGFTYTRGEPAISHNLYADETSSREFCGHCGTHILASTASSPDLMSIKVGTMDDMSLYGGPEMALQMAESNAYHLVPEGVASYPHWPWS